MKSQGRPVPRSTGVNVWRSGGALASAVVVAVLLAGGSAAAQMSACRSNSDCRQDGEVCVLEPGCDSPKGACLPAMMGPEMELCGCDGRSQLGRPLQPYRDTGPCQADAAGFMAHLKESRPVARFFGMLDKPEPARAPDQPVRISPQSACIGQEIEVRPLEGQSFAELPADTSVFFAPCALEGKILERSATRLRVQVPEGAESGCVWVGGALSKARRNQRAGLGDQCVAPQASSGKPRGTRYAFDVEPALAAPEAGLAVVLPEKTYGRCAVQCSQLCARGPDGALLSRLEVARPPRIDRFQLKDGWPRPDEGTTRPRIYQAVPGGSSALLTWSVDGAGVDATLSIQAPGEQGPSPAEPTGTRKINVAPGAVTTLVATNRCGTARRELELRTGASLAFEKLETWLHPGASREVTLRLSKPSSEDMPVALSSSSAQLEVPKEVTVKRGESEVRVPVRWTDKLLAAMPASVRLTARPASSARATDATPAPAALDVRMERPLLGYADLHNHQFANLGFGGAFVGDPRGELVSSLNRCDAEHGVDGASDIFNSLLGGGLGHPTTGWNDFEGWPSWNSYTHQTVHRKWLERAWRGGLRLMVMLAVNNKLVCDAFGVIRPAWLRPQVKHLSCSDEEAVARQLAAAKDLEQRIDAEAGGAGKGWYRIVRTPEEARQVIETGKLAVVLGMEVDAPFGCGNPRTASAPCTAAEVTAKLEALRKQGVRHLFPIHFETNAFGGAAIYQPLATVEGPGGTGLRDCGDEGYLFSSYRGLPTGSPVCNEKGLTALGQHLVREMIRLGMILDVNHMSARTLEDTLRLVAERRYPVVAGHTGFVEPNQGDGRHEGNLTAQQLQKIQAVNGMVGVITDQGNVAGLPPECQTTSVSFAEAYRYAVKQLPGSPVAFGTDFNGFAHEPGPLFLKCPKAREKLSPVTYPFKLPFDGAVWLDKDKAGNRQPYDISRDGLSHVGLLPDFIAELQENGVSRKELEPLFQSAMGYVELWQRAEDRARELAALAEPRASNTPP